MNLIADTCYMRDLFTDDASRGLGVGRELIGAIGNHCRDVGIKDIYWHTHTSNQTAQKLYDRVAKNTDFTVYRTLID